jgi:hypothetical protein
LNALRNSYPNAGTANQRWLRTSMPLPLLEWVSTPHCIPCSLPAIFACKESVRSSSDIIRFSRPHQLRRARTRNHPDTASIGLFGQEIPCTLSAGRGWQGGGEGHERPTHGAAGDAEAHIRAKRVVEDTVKECECTSLLTSLSAAVSNNRGHHTTKQTSKAHTRNHQYTLRD